MISSPGDKDEFGTFALAVSSGDTDVSVGALVVGELGLELLETAGSLASENDLVLSFIDELGPRVDESVGLNTTLTFTGKDRRQKGREENRGEEGRENRKKEETSEKERLPVGFGRVVTNVVVSFEDSGIGYVSHCGFSEREHKKNE